MKSVHPKEEEERNTAVTIKDAMSLFLAKADAEQRTKMIETLIAFNDADDMSLETRFDYLLNELNSDLLYTDCWSLDKIGVTYISSR